LLAKNPRVLPKLRCLDLSDLPGHPEQAIRRLEDARPELELLLG
jgi:hypothetical protein